MTTPEPKPVASTNAPEASETHRVLAVASAGGHWQQLMLLRPSFERHEVHFATTLQDLLDEYSAQPGSVVPDCNRDRKLDILRNLLAMRRLIRQVRPTVVISTGALPGVIALAIGRRYGAHTIWVDSVANAEEMSMSGKLARRFSDLWLSQWEEVASKSGAEYAGAVL